VVITTRQLDIGPYRCDEAAYGIYMETRGGFKVAIAPRFALVLSSLVLALQAPDYLPNWFSILRAALAGRPS